MRSDREERIRQRAYVIWQSEGHQHGRHEDHWHRAEREIDAEEAEASKGPRRAAGLGKAPAKKTAAAKPTRSRSSAADKPNVKQAMPKTRSARTSKPAVEN